MKRIVSLVIIFVMILALSACSTEGAALYEKYASIIDMLEMKDYNGAIRQITQMAMAETMEGQEKTPAVEILASTWVTRAEKGPKEMTFTTDGTLTVDGKAMTWTTDKGEFGPEMRLQIFEDGKHKYLAYFNASERYAVPSIQLYYMEEVDGYMQQGDHIGNYYNHALVPALMGNWYAVSEYEKVTEDFWFNNSEVQLNGDNYSWKIEDSSSQDQLTVKVTGKNDVTGEYTMTVSMRGEYPVMTVTDETTGTTGLYYNSNYGEDSAWVENRYAKVMSCMANFENSGYFWSGDVSYEDEEAINFLHDQFVSLDGYRDSAERLNNWDSVWFLRANRYLQRYLENEYFYAGPEDTYYGHYEGAVEFLQGLFTEISDYSEAATVLENWNDVLLFRANCILEDYLESYDGRLYMNNHSLTANESRAFLYEQFKAIEGSDEAAATLAKFTIVPQMYMGAKYVTVDNMGNQSGENTWETFKYNALGQMIYADYADEMFETYGAYSDLHFFYDDAGVLTEVKVAYNLESSVSAVMTPAYDEKGNLVSITKNTNSGTQTYTFTYDEAGRRIGAVIDNNVNGGTDTYYIYNYTYTYDEAGRLVEKVEKRNNSSYTTTYTYDANGFLIQETLVDSYYNSWDGTTTIYDTTTMTYTNDELGRHITAERASDENGFNYKSYTITYNYEDLYFYNAD